MVSVCVSGGVSGCLGMYQYKIHWQNIITGQDTQILPFFQCPLMRKNGYVWGKADGVWGCLDGIWSCLGGV